MKDSEANDALRTRWTGGRMELIHGGEAMDDVEVARILYALATYNTFEPDSLHDKGHFILSGISYFWEIAVSDERVLRVWRHDDSTAH